MADNTYRSGEYLIQTAQTQCDYANTMRLRKHNALGIVLFGGLPKKLLMCIKKIKR